MVRPRDSAAPTMLTAALLLVSCSRTATPQNLDLAEIDRMVKARDVPGLQKLVSEDAPISVLRTNGAYEAGRFGWRAFAFKGEPGSRYVVFSTPLTGEDAGELLFREEGGKLRYVSETETFGMRIARQDLTADVNLGEKSATFVDDVALTAEAGKENATTRGFLVRLGPQFKVSAITGADGKSVEFRQAGGIVWIDAPRTATTLKMAYSGTMDRPQYAGSIDAEHVQFTNEFWYPSIARIPSPYSLAVKVPDGWTAVGQGERSERDGRAVFDMRLPTSVWSFSAEPFKTFSRKDKNGRGYDVYSNRLSEEEMRQQTELFEPILDFYSRSFAPYPFPRWGAADVKTYGGGALEAYNFATYGAGFLPSEDAHEPAHTWWGGLLPNSYLRSFWNESFAVWSEGLYHRNVPIGNVAARAEAFADLAMPEASYDRVPVASGSCFIGPEASSLGYGKGGHVLAMLEQLVGTDRMIEGCKEWIRTHPKGETADWEEFEATMIRLYPTMELRSFFDVWLRTPGAAKIEVRSMKWTGNRLTGMMAPTPWRMPLEFVLVFKNGGFERRTLDTRNVGPDGSFALPSGMGKPVRVLFDPYHRALRRGPAAPSTGFFSAIRGYKVYRDASAGAYLDVPGTKVETLPKDLDKVVIVGHPRTTPALTPLLAKVGMTVANDSLTWRGTTVDLRKAGAVALVELGDGKRCAIVLGTAAFEPSVGRASVAVFDQFGRFLNGVTPLPQPKDGVFEIE